MKTAWVLGAGFASVLLALLAMLVLATGMGTAEKLSSKEALDGIDVPTIGTVGDFPDPAHRHVVNVTADGRIVVEGRTSSFPELLDELKTRGDATRGDRIPGTSRFLSDATVVLRVDGALPWGSAQRFLQACAEVSIWRISFAVRHEGDGVEGALGVPLPWDKGCEDPDDVAWKTIDVSPGESADSAADLFAWLRQSPAAFAGKLGTRLKMDPRVPTQAALAMIDASMRAGATRVELACLPAPRGHAEFQDEVARWRTVDRRVCVRIDGAPMELPEPLPPMPSVARVRAVTAVPTLSFSMLVPLTDELGSPLPEPSSPPR